MVCVLVLIEVLYVIALIGLIALLGLVAIIGLTAAGVVAPWSGRFYSLWDTGYARIHIPIISSVSEHQPTTWSNYFFDLGYIILFLPMGYYYCLVDDVTLGKIFIAIYGVLATYFSCVMIRLMLTLAPVVCVIAGIALSEIFRKTGESVRENMLDFDTMLEDEKEK